MRRSILIVVAILACAAPVAAQTAPREEFVIVPEVEVRAGPSKQFFPTSKLSRNDRVVVLRESKESPGWLEIKPPPGSFSWINGKHVKQLDNRHAIVDCDPGRPVPILPGSRLVNQEPNRESLKLTQGVILVIVDRPLQVNGETWLPVEPHQQEVRYIPAEAVKAAQVVSTVNGPANWRRMPDGFSGNPKLAEAEQARQAGDFNRARQLLLEVQNNSLDPNQRQLATNLLEKMKASPFQPTSNTKPEEVRSAFSVPGNLVQSQKTDWSPYGRLREMPLQSDYGQPLYALEDQQGRPIAYVTTIPGKSLRDYVGRMVSVYGPTVHRPDSAVRMHYIVASHLAVP